MNESSRLSIFKICISSLFFLFAFRNCYIFMTSYFWSSCQKKSFQISWNEFFFYYFSYFFYFSYCSHLFSHCKQLQSAECSRQIISCNQHIMSYFLNSAIRSWVSYWFSHIWHSWIITAFHMSAMSVWLHSAQLSDSSSCMSASAFSCCNLTVSLCALDAWDFILSDAQIS